VKKTPVIIIIDDKKDQLLRLLERKGVAVENLAKKSFIESNSALSVFSQRQANGYSAFIINEAQGRGLDFQSSAEIEMNGGNLVIIGMLPESFLQYRQFIGRTGRIG